MDRNVTIIENTEGKKIAAINNIRFRGKRSVNWDDVKDYLKIFVGTGYRLI